VQKKVMAIRTRLKAGGPPSADELARVQNAVMARARPIMMNSLHKIADTVAVEAIKDDNIIAAALARTIRGKLSTEQIKAFDAALTKAAITGDESKYAAQCAKRIDAIVEAHDPDLTGIVDSKTGKVIAGNDGR
jgi:hypothetical protein